MHSVKPRHLFLGVEDEVRVVVLAVDREEGVELAVGVVAEAGDEAAGVVVVSATTRTMMKKSTWTSSMMMMMMRRKNAIRTRTWILLHRHKVAKIVKLPSTPPITWNTFDRCAVVSAVVPVVPVVAVAEDEVLLRHPTMRASPNDTLW